MNSTLQNRIDRINSIIEFNEDNGAIKLSIYLDVFHTEFQNDHGKQYYLRTKESKELLYDDTSCFVLNDWKHGIITEVNFKGRTYSVLDIVVAFVESPKYNQCFEFNFSSKRWRVGDCSMLKSIRIENNKK
jgi:hypothetical protein